MASARAMTDYRGAFDPGFHLGRLSRRTLAAVGREYMLFGHLLTRAGLAQVHLLCGPAEREQIAIDEWQGASPVYTERLRAAFGVDGDDVASIFKCLQLDVGFAHQYMDVAYEITDDRHGEFWLESCGALLDVEPNGEELVVSMCHHIEDPTFDATAVATNPRARIRPIHRPPRRPADRQPHCHWTTVIHPDIDPVTEIALTGLVRGSRLASTELPVRDAADAAGGRDDYAGAFEPEFQLEDLSAPALVRVLGEFCVQDQLLVRSMLLSLTERHDAARARAIAVPMLVGSGWVTAERLHRALGLDDDGIDAVLKVLQVHPALGPAPYAAFEWEPVDEWTGRIRLRDCPALHEGDDCSWFALLADGETSGLDAIVHAVNRRARVEPSAPAGDGWSWDVIIDPSAAPVTEPDAVAITKLGGCASYEFVSRRPVQLRATR